MARQAGVEQHIGISKAELGEVLPPSVRFGEALEMARDALNVSDKASELLTRQVNDANERLEAAGMLDRPLLVRTPEYFRRRTEADVAKPLVHEGYPYSARPRFITITGIFEGLIVIDTKEVEYSANKIALMRGDLPERLIICGAFSATELENGGVTNYVPHEWLQGPEHAIANIRAGIGATALPGDLGA